MKIFESVEEYLSRHGLKLVEVEQFMYRVLGPQIPYFKGNKQGQYEMMYFAALSLQCQIERFVELGTGKGVSCISLSKLFPEAEIETWDLPKTDNEFSALAEAREKIFEDATTAPNVTYEEKNTFLLSSRCNGLLRPDIVWVDAGHSFPSVAWDTFWAYQNVKPGGYVLFHDYKPSEPDVVKTINAIADVIPEDIYIVPAGKRGGSYICIIHKAT